MKILTKNRLTSQFFKNFQSFSENFENFSDNFENFPKTFLHPPPQFFGLRDTPVPKSSIPIVNYQSFSLKTVIIKQPAMFKKVS
jgi:hypothetical protein